MTISAEPTSSENTADMYFNTKIILNYNAQQLRATVPAEPDWLAACCDWNSTVRLGMSVSLS